MELQESYERIIAELADDAEVLDVGGWSRPFWRANSVIDLEGYDTRGLYQRCYATGEDLQAGEERFTAATWVLRDICDREPWPFADDQFDFAVCAQTLEDVRDLLEILDDRYDRRSTLITSQLPVDQWHAYLGDRTVADAILDRLIHNAYRIPLKGESMRKQKASPASRSRSETKAR